MKKQMMLQLLLLRYSNDVGGSHLKTEDAMNVALTHTNININNVTGKMANDLAVSLLIILSLFVSMHKYKHREKSITTNLSEGVVGCGGCKGLSGLFYLLSCHFN